MRWKIWLAVSMNSHLWSYWPIGNARARLHPPPLATLRPAADICFIGSMLNDVCFAISNRQTRCVSNYLFITAIKIQLLFRTEYFLFYHPTTYGCLSYKAPLQLGCQAPTVIFFWAPPLAFNRRFKGMQNFEYRLCLKNMVRRATIRVRTFHSETNMNIQSKSRWIDERSNVCRKKS